jgi:polyribonucleotide nucleotidyltransferase
MLPLRYLHSLVARIHSSRGSGRRKSTLGLAASAGCSVGSTNSVSFSVGGSFAHLADSSAICSNGGSVVHATVCSARTLDPVDDFLPLTVDYRSRSYAFGRIPQSINRRERHGTDDEVLVARVIDRAIRPLFPPGFVNEVQITVTAHAVDGVHDPTITAVNAASCALTNSNLPWKGPIGCVRVGLMPDGVLKVDPTVEEMKTSTLDLVYACTRSRPLM